MIGGYCRRCLSLPHLADLNIIIIWLILVGSHAMEFGIKWSVSRCKLDFVLLPPLPGFCYFQIGVWLDNFVADERLRLTQWSSMPKFK